MPAKPNHPWEDLGDAFIYFLTEAMLMPSRDRVPPRIEVISDFELGVPGWAQPGPASSLA